jgi:hypothetical protein
MTELRKNTDGFSVFELLLVIGTLGIIGIAGYFVAKHIDNKPKTTATNTNSSSQSSTTSPPSVNSYAGWNSYCDATGGGCVKYPADWVPNTNTPAGNTPGFFKNPQGTLFLTLGKESDEDICGPGCTGSDFYTNSFNALSTNMDTLKVLGGYNTVANVPSYTLIDSSLVQEYGLSIGKVTPTNGVDGLTYTSKTGVKHYALTVYAVSESGSFSKADANTWFNSTDGKLALQIVQSFYFQ